MNKRTLKGNIFKAISYIAAAITLLALIGIIGRIALEALPSLSLYFLITPESKVPGLGGGIANAIAGTVLLSILSTALATPLAIGTAVYLKRYAKPGILVRAFGFMLDVLAGTPSIVLAIFGLLFLVIYLKLITGGFSLIAGTITLTILILPVIERAAEGALDTVPTEIEEASYALGASKWDTVRRITVPFALTGILTGVILGIGRAAEESAIVILTAGYTQFLPEFKVLPREGLLFGLKFYPFQDLAASLPYTVYLSFQSPHLYPVSNGFAAAFVLIVIVMLINAATRMLIWRSRIG
jgi:phosphate transport system permease protein